MSQCDGNMTIHSQLPNSTNKQKGQGNENIFVSKQGSTQIYTLSVLTFLLRAESNKKTIFWTLIRASFTDEGLPATQSPVSRQCQITG